MFTTAFALSGESVTLDVNAFSSEHRVNFSDASGSYTMHLADAFFEENPGNTSVDVYQLAAASRITVE